MRIARRRTWNVQVELAEIELSAMRLVAGLQVGADDDHRRVLAVAFLESR
jgi:hypothetical protein